MLVRFRADVGARDAGVEFGPERDRIAAAILERVHLLRDDIGGLTERAREHGRRLEHRDFEALEAIEPPHAIQHIGAAREAALALPENVLRAADADIASATGRESVCPYGSISLVAVQLNNKLHNNQVNNNKT